MIGTSRELTARKAILIVLGVSLFASASFGGYTLWTRSGDETPTPVSVEPRSAPIAAAQTPAVPGASVDAVVSSPVVVKTSANAEPADTPKKMPPQGKSHDRQDVQLAFMVRILHSEAYERFISQPGMGMSRMVPTISVMPREWKVPQWTSEELVKLKPPVNEAKDLGLIHRLSLKNFGASNTKTDAERWEDYATDARNKELKKEYLWEIKSLDLVGLVMHETPVVYISEKIPEMKDLKNKPTRDMDVFESEGLEELASGKPLYMRSKDETIRVLGPIQAAKACLKCHGDAKEGDLLGAFSYTLRKGQYVSNGRGIPGFTVPPANGLTPPGVPKK
jgi:hypothetical protein